MWFEVVCSAHGVKCCLADTGASRQQCSCGSKPAYQCSPTNYTTCPTLHRAAVFGDAEMRLGIERGIQQRCGERLGWSLNGVVEQSNAVAPKLSGDVSV
ncbi:hypothetical protein TcWFU_010430 [Taenia crassiceps]|uniref:Uncharacterized protein n=1 Tax=Taenia crassiceps TaxID=6207 RepID=A0ABR4Q0A6_9CEST